MSRFSAAVLVAAALVQIGCEEPQSPTYPDSIRNPDQALDPTWTYQTGVNLIGKPWVLARTSGSRPFSMLAVACNFWSETGTVDIWMSPGYQGLQSGDVRYQIDAAPAVSARWQAEPNLDSGGAYVLFYLGASPAVEFAELLARSNRFTVTSHELLGSEHTAEFATSGLTEHLPKVRSFCGV